MRRSKTSLALISSLVPLFVSPLASAQDYRLKLLVSTGGNLQAIDPDVALNDRGTIAFTGRDAQGSKVFVLDHGTLVDVAPAIGGRLYTGVAINDAAVPAVAARDRDSGSPLVYRIRTWPADGSQLPTLIGFSQTHFNSATNFVDVNDAGVVSFTGLINSSSQTALFAGTAVPPVQLALFAGNVPLRPQMSNTIPVSNVDKIVMRDSQDRVQIWSSPTGAIEFVAGPTSGFSTTGRAPGIDRNAGVVAFLGTRNGEGAFVAVRTTTGAWQVVRAAGEGLDAFTDFDQDQRICVRASGDLFSGMSITVLFGASVGAVSGAYAVELSALEVGGVVQAVASPARSVARAGDVVGSRTLAGTWIYDSLNRHGVVALFAAFTDGTSGIVRALADRDGDGLLDTWEIAGLDFDDDGTLDLDLPALGADPDHKDVFVEIDALNGFAPAQLELDRVAQVFAQAPAGLVQNPDGQAGITLHNLLDETTLAASPWTLIDASGWPLEFDAAKAAHFGTLPERTSPNAHSVLEAKKLAFRYCIFAHSFDVEGHSGLAEGGAGVVGNDFLVSLGDPVWPVAGGTPDERAGTYMHELGHTLGLGHGGGDSTNHKPNYISVMNYAWSMPGLANAGQWELWFSDRALPPLNEAGLDENAGVGGDPYLAITFGPPPIQIAMQSGPIDWNRDADSTDSGVAADITQLFPHVPSTPGEVLLGWEDWSTLLYDFTDSRSYADGAHPDVPDDELTAAEHVEALTQPPQPGAYCTAKANSLGCTAAISSSGTPTLSGADDFVVAASPVRNRKPGALLWGFRADSAPFAGGVLCIETPMKRIPLLSSGGSASGNDCSGAYSQSFTHAFFNVHGLAAGTQLFAQFVSRDPGFAPPDSLALSNALVFVVGP